MYIELIITLWALQTRLLEVLESVNHDRGMGLFVLSHITTSLDFLERTQPPASCKEVHRLCIECQKLSIRSLAIELDGRPVPKKLLKDYNAAITACADAVDALSAPSAV